MISAFLSLLFAATGGAAAQSATNASPTPGEILAGAPAADWVTVDEGDLIVVDLTPGASRAARRVVIQLAPAPLAEPWTANIRALAKAKWWDGTSVNRVQDNYVVQWGDASEKKPLPGGLAVGAVEQYEVDLARLALVERTAGPADVYAAATMFYRGWPLGVSGRGNDARAWPVHCYGMIGVGRNVAPDTGSGAELYAVIGHAPRHLDRNIAVVGRVVEGIEHLSSLPRGTAELGFYDRADQRTPITRVRLASELPAAERPRYQYLSTRSDSWARYAAARSNRRDSFFIRPAGAADICNLPVPVRRSGS